MRDSAGGNGNIFQVAHQVRNETIKSDLNQRA